MPSKSAKPPKRKRRVLLVCSQPLLGEAVEAILIKLTDLELLGPTDMNVQVPKRLSQDPPDVVIVAEENGDIHNSTSLTALVLDRFPNVPVIRMGPEKNTVRLYTTRSLPAHGTDLIEAIRRVRIPVRPDLLKGSST
jgi:DNA-binding NarL/FixJ family response regulator